MTLVGLLVLLVVAGFVLTLMPLDPTMRKLIIGVIVLIVCLAMLRFAGVF